MVLRIRLFPEFRMIFWLKPRNMGCFFFPRAEARGYYKFFTVSNLRCATQLKLCCFKWELFQKSKLNCVDLWIYSLFKCSLTDSLPFKAKAVKIYRDLLPHQFVNIHLCKILCKHKAMTSKSNKQAFFGVNNIAWFNIIP